MKGGDLLITIYKLNKESQPLIALLAEQISKRYADTNGNPSQGFAKRLKTCFNSKIEKIFKGTINDTAKKIFKNPDKNKRKKNEVKDQINPKELDSYILLKIMTETDFLPERREKTCTRCQLTKCCSTCDGHDQNKCGNCDTDKNHCGKICCDTCNICVKCSSGSFEKFSECYFFGFKGRVLKLSEIPSWNLCLGINILSSLGVLLKCRNLFHLTEMDCEKFLQQKELNLGDFRGLQNLDQFVKKIHLAMKTIIHVLKKSSHQEIVEEVEDIEDKIDQIIDDDSKLCFRIEESEGIALINQLLKEFSLTDEERKSIKKTLQDHEERLRDHEKRISKLEKESQLEKEKEEERTRKSLLILKYVNTTKCVLSTREKMVGGLCLKIRCEGESDEKKAFTQIQDDTSNTFLVVNDLFLEHGNEFRFILEMQNGETLQSDLFQPEEGCEAPGVSVTDCLNTVVAYDDGLPTSCHRKQKTHHEMNFKPVDIIRAASVPVKTVEEFRQLATKYMKRNNFQTCFPPSYLLRNQVMKMLVEKVFHCNDGKKKDIKALIGYDHIKHLKNYNCSNKELNCTFNKDCRDISHEDTIFLVDFEKVVVYYIRMVDDMLSSATVYAELEQCNDFVRAFFLLHGDTFAKNHHVAVCSILALPKMEKKNIDPNIVPDNERYILFKEDLQTTDVLQAKLQGYYRTVSKERKNWSHSADGKKLEGLLAECMASMAIKKACLPRLTRDVKEQVVSLLLNVEQYEAIHHLNNKRIISGPFGSGKSLILEKIAEQLYQSSTNATIYYICCDSHSLLDVRMEETFKSLTKGMEKDDVEFVTSNLYEILKEAGEDNVDDLVKVMEYCLKKGQENHRIVHFLFDEVDPIYFNEEMAKKFGDFVRKEVAGESTVILALQCTEKVVTANDGSTKHTFQNHCTNQSNPTGLELLPPLKMSMRMVSNLYKIKQIAEDQVKKETHFLALKKEEAKKESFQHTVKKKTTQALKSKKPVSKMSQPFQSIPPNKDAKAPVYVPNETLSEFVRHVSEDTKLKEPTADHLPEMKKPKAKKPQPFLSDVEGTLQQTKPPVEKKVEVKVKAPGRTLPSPAKQMSAVDQLYQLPMRDPHIFTQDKLESDQKHLETKFKFHDSENGVNVQSDKEASVIYLNDQFNLSSVDSVMILKEIFEIKDFLDVEAKTTVICNTLHEVDAVLFALKKTSTDKSYCRYTSFLEDIKIPASREKKENIWSQCKDDSHEVLVTDFRCFRGCETEHCITFVKADHAEFIPQILVEVFARAIVHLLIFVLPSPQSKNGRFAQVLKEWHSQKAADIFRLSVSYNKDSTGLSIVKNSEKEPVHNNIPLQMGTGDLQKEYDLFKKESHKKLKRNDSESEFKRHLADYIPDILQQALDKLTNDQYRYDVITFVESKHLAYLNGSRERTIEQLKQELGVDLIINKFLKEMQIRGTLEKKQNAVKKIKSKLDSGFWETLDWMPPSFQRDILKKAPHWKTFGVDVRKTREQKLQARGEMGNLKKVTSEIKDLINNPTSLWKPLVLSGSLSKYVHTKKSDEDFKHIRMRLNFNTGKLEIHGSQSEATNAERTINEYLKKKRPLITNDMVETLVMLFHQSKAHNDSWNLLNDKHEYWEILYQVSIRIVPNERAVYIRGSDEKKKVFTVYLRKNLFYKERVGSGDDYKKAYLLRVSALDGEIQLAKSEQMPHLLIITHFEGVGMVKHAYQIPSLKDDFIRALARLHEKCLEFGEMSLKFHLGRAFIRKLGEGPQKIVRLLDNVVYQRMDDDVFLSHINRQGWEKINTGCRYDFKIYTAEPFVAFRYKIFIDSNNQIDCKQTSQYVSDIQQGIGSFSWPESGVARLDIVDPVTNLDLRLRIKMYESNTTFENNTRQHAERLRQSFFSKLALKPGTNELVEIPDDLPDGYIVSYCRRSAMESYKVTGTDLVVKLSHEQVLQNYDHSDMAKEARDIYIENIRVYETLQSNDWNAREVAEQFQCVFDFGLKLLEEMADNDNV